MSKAGRFYDESVSHNENTMRTQFDHKEKPDSARVVFIEKLVLMEKRAADYSQLFAGSADGLVRQTCVATEVE